MCRGIQVLRPVCRGFFVIYFVANLTGQPASFVSEGSRA